MAVPHRTERSYFGVWVPDATSKFAPLIVDGLVVFGGRDSTVHADGSLVWERETDRWVETSPTVADGVVHVGTASGQLLGLDVTTGDRVYEAANPSEWYTAAIAIADTVIYGVTDHGILTANHRTTGELLWQHEMTRISPQQQVPAPVDGHVFCADGTGTAYAFSDPSQMDES